MNHVRESRNNVRGSRELNIHVKKGQPEAEFASLLAEFIKAGICSFQSKHYIWLMRKGFGACFSQLELEPKPPSGRQTKKEKATPDFNFT
jgi:hypothetical protein